jgi:hypothetical protein
MEEIMNQFQKDQLKAQADELRRQSEAAFERWLKRAPQVIDCTANRKAFAEYADWEDGLTESDFEFAFGNLKDRLALQSLRQAKARIENTEAEQKASLIDEIIRLLETGGARNTAHDLQTERAKLGFQSVPQLQARRDSIVCSQAAAAKSVSQLRAELTEARRDTRRYPGYPDLPQEWVPPGKVLAVKVDSKFLKSLGAGLRSWCGRYGFEQINDAIRERIAE